jgi:hypothetical protein
VTRARCACGNRLEAETDGNGGVTLGCPSCGRAEPINRRLATEPGLDRRAIELRQTAVLGALTPQERRALATVCGGLGVVGPWWALRSVRRVFVLLALDHLTAQGGGLREAADTVGLPRETCRDWMAELLREKATG